MGIPYISIIVPVYNTQNDLPKCFESIINQTLKRIEFVIINDGSTDDSDLIIKKYCRIDNRFIYIKQNNMGLGAARNMGISRASGKYIMFVDSDDWIENNACETLYNNAKRFKVDVVVFNYFLIQQNNRIEIRHTYQNSQIISGDQYLLKSMKEGSFSPTVCNKLIKKRVLDKLKFPEGIIHEDIYFSIILLSMADRVLTLKATLYGYNKSRVDSITNSLTKKNVNDILSIYDKTIKHLKYLDKINLINNKSFKLNIIERINLEILIKLIDNKKKSKPDDLINILKSNKRFNELASFYIYNGQSTKHKLITLLFKANYKIFLVVGRVVYFTLSKLNIIKW